MSWKGGNKQNKVNGNGEEMTYVGRRVKVGVEGRVERRKREMGMGREKGMVTRHDIMRKGRKARGGGKRSRKEEGRSSHSQI